MSTAATVHEVTTEAINRSEANANPSFLEYALDLVKTLATTKQEVTIDDVREAYDYSFKNNGFVPFTHNNSAYGPVILRAVDAGYITKKEGAAVKSRRPSSHGRLLRVFTSNIFVAKTN